MKNKLTLIILLFFTIILIGCENTITPDNTQFHVKFEDNGVVVNDYVIDLNEKIEFPKLTKEGYTLTGIYKDSSFENEWDFSYDLIMEDITLYIKWEINKYQITFSEYEELNAKVEYNSLVEKPSDPIKTGYTFIGWYKEESLTNLWNFNEEKVISNITLYPKWKINKYTVKFSETDLSDIKVEYNALIEEPNVTKEGYSLDGWYTDSSLTNKWNFEKDKVESDITLYPKYIARKYPVTFEEGSTIELEYDSLVKEPATPSKIGYTFIGWYKDSNLTEKWNFSSDRVKGVTKIYIKWEINKYQITFSEYEELNAKVEYNSLVEKPSDPIKTGYTFIGWYKEEMFITKWNFNRDKVKGDITLYARWGKENEEFTEGLEFELNDDEESYSVTGYIGDETEVVIPSTYLGLLVTSISNLAFSTSNCEKIEYITIPNDIERIGKYAFSMCTSLLYNEYSNGLYLGNSENKYLVLVKTKDINITSIIINENTKIICYSALHNCELLKEIVIGNNIKHIGYQAFMSCISLNKVYYDGTISDWCDIEFTYDTSQVMFHSYTSNPMYFASHFYIKDDNDKYKEVTEMEIPNTVTEIGHCQFYGFKNVTSITIPDSVTSIHEDAFYDCYNLNNIINNSNLEFSFYSKEYGMIGYYALKINNKGNVLYKGNEEEKYIITDDGFKFLFIDNKYYLISYLGDDKVPVLPATINGKKYYCQYMDNSLSNIKLSSDFTYIYEKMFKYSQNLISIVIPNSITKIENCAFALCQSLVSVEIPDSIESIGYEAFYNCISLEKVFIPSKMRYINKRTFNYCTSLTDVIIGEGIKEIGEAAFSYCISLKNAAIPSSVEKVENWAFQYCYCLENIKIPNSVKSIGSYGFFKCKSSEEIYYEGTIEDWCKISISKEYPFGDYGFEYSSMHFYMKDANGEYKEITEIVIPNTITEIGKGQFFSFNNVTSIEIPKTVNSISYNAFYNCTSLDKVYYEGTIEDWCNIKFYREYYNHRYSNPMCYANHFYMKNSNGEYQEVTEIEIPNTVTKIGDFQFYGFDNATSVKITNNITSIGIGAFYNCESLDKLYYEGTIADWCNIEFADPSANPMYYAKYFYMKDSNGVYQEVTEIVIPNIVTKISRSLFTNFSKATSVTIPNSVISVGIEAFDNCISLDKVYYEGTIADWCNIEFADFRANPMYYAKHFYMKDSNGEYQEITEIEIPNTVTMINNYQFYGFENVKKIELSKTVTTIGRFSFDGCKSLTNITISNGIISIGGWAFNECEALIIYCEQSSEQEGWTNGWNANRNVYYGVDEIIEQEGIQYLIIDGNAMITKFVGNGTKVAIPSAIIVNDTKYCVKTIGSSAFCNSSITSVIIPNTIENIFDNAFSSCNSLTIYCENDLPLSTWIEYWHNGRPVYYGIENVIEREGIQYLIMDENAEVTRYAGSNKEVKIPSTITYNNNTYNVKRIGVYAFSYSEITNIIIPDSVTSIGDYAFSGCSSLTSITIPDSVTYIGRWAFENCNNLTKVYYNGSENDWNNITIGNSNYKLTDATRYYYSETEPSLNDDETAYNGNYWHYDTDGKTIVEWIK